MTEDRDRFKDGEHEIICKSELWEEEWVKIQTLKIYIDIPT